MATHPKHLHTFEQYLELERAADFRSEFYAGDIYAMSGGTPIHSRLSARSVMVLGRFLSKCQIFDGNLKIRIEATNEGFYPDAMAICGEPRLWNDHVDVIVNPTLVVEVLSPSTQKHDQGHKVASYRTIPSLRHILVISQDRIFVEHYVRVERGWLISSYSSSADRIELPGLAMLEVQEFYQGILNYETPVSESSSPTSE